MDTQGFYVMIVLEKQIKDSGQDMAHINALCVEAQFMKA